MERAESAAEGWIEKGWSETRLSAARGVAVIATRVWFAARQSGQRCA